MLLHEQSPSGQDIHPGAEFGEPSQPLKCPIGEKICARSLLPHRGHFRPSCFSFMVAWMLTVSPQPLHSKSYSGMPNLLVSREP